MREYDEAKADQFYSEYADQAHDMFHAICDRYSDAVCESTAYGFWEDNEQSVRVWKGLGLNLLHAFAVLDMEDDFWAEHHARGEEAKEAAYCEE